MPGAIGSLWGFLMDWKGKIRTILTTAAWVLNTPFVNFKIETGSLSPELQNKICEIGTRLTDGSITDEDLAFLCETVSKIL